MFAPVFKTMKTILLSVTMSLVAAIGSLWAQPTLNNHEKFTPGSVVNFYVMDTSNIHSGASGANVVWNFANLVQTSETYTKQYILPEITEMGDSFPAATLAEVGNDGTTLYLLERNDTIYEIGAWLDYNNILLKYSRPQVRRVSPQTYLSVCTGNALYQYKYDTYPYKSGGAYTITADSYGTLVLPQATYNNVVRIRTETLYYDTLQGAGSYVQQVHRVKHSWYNVYNNAPLFEMDSVRVQSPFFNSTRRGVYTLKNPSNSVATATKEDVRVWVNQSCLNVAGLPEDLPTAYIYDALGKMITKATRKTGTTTAEYALEHPLTKGIYYIVLPANSVQYTAKLLVD